MNNFNKLPYKILVSKTYAGIGSRETPFSVLEQMTEVAQRLERRGYTLRTGDASGADQAFREAVENKEVFIAKDATEFTLDVAREIHPAPQVLKPYVLKLQARNCFQVFGKDLNDPVDFVLCWTPDGMESHLKRTRKSGGTGQAIDMASRKGIPVINMKNKGWEDKLEEIINPSNQTSLFS